MGKGNVQTHLFIYTAETIFPFIAHHKNPLATAIFTATLSSTPQVPITHYTTYTFPSRNYKIATCVTYMQALPLHSSFTLLEGTVGVNTVSPKFVRASSKGTNVQTGKDLCFTIERLVKVVLIARVSSNKYGVGDILEG